MERLDSCYSGCSKKRCRGQWHQRVKQNKELNFPAIVGKPGANELKIIILLLLDEPFGNKRNIAAV